MRIIKNLDNYSYNYIEEIQREDFDCVAFMGSAMIIPCRIEIITYNEPILKEILTQSDESGNVEINIFDIVFTHFSSHHIIKSETFCVKFYPNNESKCITTYGSCSLKDKKEPTEDAGDLDITIPLTSHNYYYLSEMREDDFNCAAFMGVMGETDCLIQIIGDLDGVKSILTKSDESGNVEINIFDVVFNFFSKNTGYTAKRFYVRFHPNNSRTYVSTEAYYRVDKNWVEPPSIEEIKKYLIGNPVWIEYQTVYNTPVLLEVFIGEKTFSLVASSGYTGLAQWNIAQVLESVIKKIELEDLETNSDVIQLRPLIFDYKIITELLADPLIVEKYDNTAFYGGIPKSLFRKLTAAGTDIFEAKLQNYTTNCFLTTRGNEERITLPVDELGYLYMIGDENPHALTVAASTGESGDIAIPAGIALNAINIRSITLAQPGSYTIAIDDVIVLTITVTPQSASRERYLLKFRNSYGVYERLEVTGRATSEPEYSEESTYSIYDNITDSLRNERFRREKTEVIKVECGYRTRERLLFVRDMLISEDVRLLGSDGEWIKVIVNADSDSIAIQMKEPSSIPLSIRFAEADNRYSADDQISSITPGANLLTYDNNHFIQLDDESFVSL